MDRKNINRDFKKLKVWQGAISFYVLPYKKFSRFPFELKKVAANSIDAAHRISRNISDCHEGMVIPGTYKNIHGQVVKIDPKNLDPNTEVIRF